MKRLEPSRPTEQIVESYEGRSKSKTETMEFLQ